jgi:hypothetical protein
LALEPLGELLESVFKRNAGLIIEDLTRERDVGETMTDVTDAIALGDFWLDVIFLEDARKSGRYFADRESLAAADVEHAIGRGGNFERQATRLGDIADVHKVTLLASILENLRWQVVQQLRSEDREHAGVRIRERLPRPVDIEKP